MSTELALFDFNGHQVRVFPTEDGQSFYAVAKDATDILGYAEAKDGLRRVPAAHKGRRLVPTPGGLQEMLCVTEPGLYRLILRSDKPEAEPFMEWVTSRVLPSIRKTGGYLALPQGPLTLAEFREWEARLEATRAALLDLPVVVSAREALGLIGRGHSGAEPLPGHHSRRVTESRRFTPEDDRQLLELRREGYGMVQISKTMDRARSSVENRLRRLQAKAEDKAKPAEGDEA